MMIIEAKKKILDMQIRQYLEHGYTPKQIYERFGVIINEGTLRSRWEWEDKQKLKSPS